MEMKEDDLHYIISLIEGLNGYVKIVHKRKINLQLIKEIEEIKGEKTEI